MPEFHAGGLQPASLQVLLRDGQVAVIGSAHERWVEQVTAVVVPNREGVTADDVAAFCATNPNLRGMHRPRRIEIVDALPRTGSGKLNRPELRKLFP
jgi:long-chain acyl-CoA synthetase